LYDTRAEAEFARARLVSRIKARSPRIIGKDTAAAVDGLDIAPAAADAYRDGIRGGAHLLVAHVPSGTRPDRIIEVLKQAAGHTDRRGDQQWGDAEHGVRVDLREDPLEPFVESEAEPRRVDVDVERESAAASPESEDTPRFETPEEEPVPEPDEESRRPEAPVSRGSARVRSFTREAAAEKQVSLNHEVVEVEMRPSERQLSEGDVESGDLFQERVFEIAAMREEPVVTKVAVVREEVIVRKTLKARVETIRDTVRHTEVGVEAPPGAEGPHSTFFSPSSD
jgi:hypothetical protein